MIRLEKMERLRLNNCGCRGCVRRRISRLLSHVLPVYLGVLYFLGAAGGSLGLFLFDAFFGSLIAVGFFIGGLAFRRDVDTLSWTICEPGQTVELLRMAEEDASL